MIAQPIDPIRRAGIDTLGELLSAQARRQPNAPALVDGQRIVSYGVLNSRVNRLANVLTSLTVARGDRIAILSENRAEYIELTLAAAKLGVILCALNWRLAMAELRHCIELVKPKIVMASPRFARDLAATHHSAHAIEFDALYEQNLDRASEREPPIVVEPEDGLLILYTSGTTGMPKGALISHRAELARLAVSRIDLDLQPTDSFVAWAPMFHMVSLEHALHVLALGGKVIVVDGADIARIVDLIESERQWWLVLLPGMLDRVVEEMKRRNSRPKGIKLIGALADLVPAPLIAEASRLMEAPYWNTFGSTETGMLPAAGTRFAPGLAPDSVAKTHNSLYLWRLVDTGSRDVGLGQPGEMAVRGPTVFSGYWNAAEVNREAFRGGWYHMGDMFVENPDGTLNFVDRSKYLIKSGGENIYPVEIERALMSDPRVAEAVVVKKRDPKWGEVPIAYVAVHDAALTADELMAVCRQRLSSYKCPREIHLVDSADDFPRSTSGKVQRHVVERWSERDPK